MGCSHAAPEGLSLLDSIRPLPRRPRGRNCILPLQLHFSSRKHTLATGLVYVLPPEVLSSADLTLPSSPGKTRTTRAKGHDPLDRLDSAMSTKSPTCRFLAF